MPHVAILAVEGCYVSCAAGFADVLQVANVHLRQQQGQDCRPFEWRFVSPEGGSVAASNGMQIETQSYDRRARFDIIAIPAIHYPGFKPFVQFLDRQIETYEWLRSQWNAGAWIGANCTGTFMLAQSGLLDGRRQVCALDLFLLCGERAEQQRYDDHRDRETEASVHGVLPAMSAKRPLILRDQH